MTGDPTTRSDRFAVAWQEWDQAQDLLKDLVSAWNRTCETCFDAYVTLAADGWGEVYAWMNWPQATRATLNSLSQRFGAAVQQALDGAVVATASTVSGVFEAPDRATVSFPVTLSFDEFRGRVQAGALRGVRPDQAELIEWFQPLDDLRELNLPAWLHLVHQSMRLLHDLQHTVNPSGDKVAPWAHSAAPEFYIDPPCSIGKILVDPPGVAAQEKRIATFQVTGHTGLPLDRRPPVRANPAVAFDLVPAFEPWPTDPDDTLGRRCRQLLSIAAEAIESLERSLQLRAPLPDRQPWQAQLPRRPRSAVVPWTALDQVAPHQATEAAVHVAESDIGIATLHDSQDMVLFVETPDAVFVRQIPRATALDPRLPQGQAAEQAAGGAAQVGGLPDFVFPPEIRRTGSGSRELGDGLVFFGDGGLILQVKSRHSETTNSDRERSWVTKQINTAGRQAAGTLRQLRRQPATFCNQRGREVELGGDGSWLGVVIIDHSHPPMNLIPPTEVNGLPIVALLRRDWQFLFDQLRSTAAVGEYLHRVVGQPLPLGEEPVRYYELARADIEAEPQVIDTWFTRAGGEHQSRPRLPQAPASLHEPGYSMFQILLNDIATSPLNTHEINRLQLLASLDRIPVIFQAEIGEHLLALLHTMPDVAPGETRFDYRWFSGDEPTQQFGFAVANYLSDVHREAFHHRLLLQHWRMQQAAPQPRDPTLRTVAVLLTPRHGPGRRWDTTTYAVEGGIDLDHEQVQALEAFFASSVPDATR